MAATQLALVAVLFLLCREGRVLAGDQTSTALRNGTNLGDLERTLHLPNEESLQQLVLNKHELIRAANWYYVGAHFLVTGIDMVDTGSVFGPSPYQGAVRGAANQFAAMPSLHVGWAVLVAIVLWHVAPPAWQRHEHDALTSQREAPPLPRTVRRSCSVPHAPDRSSTHLPSGTVRRTRRSACPPHETSRSSASTPQNKAETSAELRCRSCSSRSMARSTMPA